MAGRKPGRVKDVEARLSKAAKDIQKALSKHGLDGYEISGIKLVAKSAAGEGAAMAAADESPCGHVEWVCKPTATGVSCQNEWVSEPC